MKSKANAVREAKSRQELKDYFNPESNYGMYSVICDREQQSVARYLERGELLPSLHWTNEFVQSEGRFDSCGSWGITPQMGIEYEQQGIPAEFAGKMLALLGRADYDYKYLPAVYSGGFTPQKRSEFHAYVRGIHRRGLVKKAGAQNKSTLRLGWMAIDEFYRHILETSSKVGEGTSYSHFNGIAIKGSFEIRSNEWIEYDVLLENISNPVFKKWLAKRPNQEELERRQQGGPKIGPVGSIKKVPAHLMAAAMRHGKEYFRKSSLYSTWTSTGTVYDCGDGHTLVSGYGLKARTISGRKVSDDLAVAKISDIWFVWNPTVGFQRHMEASSLKEAVRMWNSRSKKGEPRPLTLNEVRNDRQGTSGFCLTGTKAFLENRMPHVYRLVKAYTNWSEIPVDIMSTVWDVDFSIFKGYPVP